MTKFAFFAAAIAATATAATLPSDVKPLPTGAPQIAVAKFETKEIHTIPLVEIIEWVKNQTEPEIPEEAFTPFAAAATCTNPKVRTEWHETSDTLKQQFVDGVKCLFGKPSKGGYFASKNRYEDFVQVHQVVTDAVHNNRKFILWHRAFLWSFEQALQNECGFPGSIPWFDETKFTGKFSQSSIFSAKWLGSINIGGKCVTDGQFANLALNIGPGTQATNQYHCLARKGDATATKEVTASLVNGCTALKDFQDFALCAEQGAHAYGHNGIGSVMRDVYASPGDPVFWLHHGMVDRHYRIWQNADKQRLTYVNGVGPDGKQLTLDTNIFLNSLKPNLKVADIIDTMGGFLCYKYNR